MHYSSSIKAHFLDLSIYFQRLKGPFIIINMYIMGCRRDDLI